MAHVHLVIIGFNCGADTSKKFVYTVNHDGTIDLNEAKYINAYLFDAPYFFVESRERPLFDVPEIGIWNEPIDGGNYLFKKSEMEDFIIKEPEAVKKFTRGTELTSLLIIVRAIVFIFETVRRRNLQTCRSV